MKKTLLISVMLVLLFKVGLSARASGFSPMIGYQNFWTLATSGFDNENVFSSHQVFPAVGIDFINSAADMVEYQTRILWGTPTISPGQALQTLYFSWGPTIFFMPFEDKFNIYMLMGFSMMFRFDLSPAGQQVLNGFLNGSRFDYHAGGYMGVGVEYQVHPKIWLKAEAKFDVFIMVYPHPFAGGISFVVGPVFRLF